MFEYKGFFSSVRRKDSGKYYGTVTGENGPSQDIEAGSICQFRRLFEEVVDEFIHRQACARSNDFPKRPPDRVN